MNKADAFMLIIIALFLGSFIGVIIGGSYPKYKIISERISACETEGGKYMYFYSTTRNEYVETCNAEAKIIEKF